MEEEIWKQKMEEEIWKQKRFGLLQLSKESKSDEEWRINIFKSNLTPRKCGKGGGGVLGVLWKV